MLKAQAAKVWGLTTSPAEPPAAKDAARKRFAEIAERAGITPAQLLTAIGAGVSN